MKRSIAALICIATIVALSALPLVSAEAGGAGTAPGAPTARRAGTERGGGKGSPIRGGAKYAGGRVLVKFKNEAPAARRIASSTRTIGSTGIEVLNIGTADVRKTVEWLRTQPGVEYAEPDYVRSINYTPVDPQYLTKQWNFKNDPANGGINMPAAWDVSPGGSSSVVVAILDSGVAYRESGATIYKSPDFINTHFTNGYDFINNDQYADDDNGHGTHVTGTVAESANADYVLGAAFETTIMPVKIMDASGSGTDSQIIDGIVFAADHGVEVINMSLGGPDANFALEDACDYALNKNVVVVAAAGNEDVGAIEYPAAYASCVAVGATTRSKARAHYSNYGGDLDIVAPGGDETDYIWQVTYRDRTRPSSGDFALVGEAGTSMATPHVSAVAALLKAVHPLWTASEIRGAITNSAYDLGGAGWDPMFGWGLLDASGALNAAKPSLAPPDPTSVTPVHADAGAATSMTVDGSSFSSKVKVILSRESEGSASGTGVTVTGGTEATCSVDLGGVQPGIWDVTVENSYLRGGTLPGAFVVDNADNKTWYLAEGSTAHGFEEFILIQNPNAAAANATVTLMAPDGALPPLSAAVPGNSRVTLKVNDVAPDTDVSAKITADRDIICERSMYWSDRIEGTDCIGVQSPSYTWHLAEGSTNYGYETFLLIQNPTSEPALVDVTYMTATGPVPKAQFAIRANSRYSINVADDVPNADMSFKVVSDQRVIAERSMYWDGRRGGHDSIGTTAPAMNWYLAEGSTDWGYTEYVLIENPDEVAANVTLTYMTPAGSVPQPGISVPAGSRRTVRVNDSLPSEDVSVRVSADTGVVAERAMYWNNGSGKAGHDAMGVPQARTESFLAEGSTDWGFDEWILVQNPNGTAANVGIDYMTGSGLVPRNVFSLAAHSRVSIHVNSDVPGVDTSARVYSNLPVIAERSMYWHGNGGGHVSTGLMK